jgi:hypothetical protein
MREFIKDAYVRGHCPSRKKIIFSKGKKTYSRKKNILGHDYLCYKIKKQKVRLTHHKFVNAQYVQLVFSMGTRQLITSTVLEILKS